MTTKEIKRDIIHSIIALLLGALCIFLAMFI